MTMYSSSPRIVKSTVEPKELSPSPATAAWIKAENNRVDVPTHDDVDTVLPQAVNTRFPSRTTQLQRGRSISDNRWF